MGKLKEMLFKTLGTLDTYPYVTADDTVTILADSKLSLSNGVTLNLDTVDNLTIVYKNHEYVIDPETLISLLFNYEEIIREIVREELKL